MSDIQKLRNSPLDTQFLTSLAVSLRSKPISWINAFIENSGLTVLLDNLKKVEEGERKAEHEELYIKCLKSLMNNTIGLSAVLDAPAALPIIGLSLRSPNIKTRQLVLEILGAVCLVPGGHSLILEAMSYLRERAGEARRFETVVKCLTGEGLGFFGLVEGYGIASPIQNIDMSIPSPMVTSRIPLSPSMPALPTSPASISSGRTGGSMTLNTLTRPEPSSPAVYDPDPVVAGFKFARRSRHIADLQVASLSFINAIICGGPGKDQLEIRMHLRYEFLNLGILTILEVSFSRSLY